MTPADPDDKRILALLSAYLRPDLPEDDVSAALTKALEAFDDDLDEPKLKRLTEALLSATDESSISKIRAMVLAYVARLFLAKAIINDIGHVPEHATKWLSLNVNQAPRHQTRVAAIWRVTAGLTIGDDKQIYDQAYKAALAGQTPEPGTEDNMLDPTTLRNAILGEVEFNPMGLPKTLRETDQQNIYIDAVVQNVLLHQHFTEGDDDSAKLWSAAVAALLLADGYFDPRDRKFYNNVQREIVELAGSAVESSKIAIDGHDVNMYAPTSATQRIEVFKLTYDRLRSNAGSSKLFLQSVGRVARSMAERYDDHRGIGTILNSMIDAAYASDVVTANDGGEGGGIANLELPPLNDPQGSSDEIEPENIRAVSTIYVTYQLEFALKALSRILDLFVAGLLPISASDGSARELDNLYWHQDDLLDEASRRSVYSRVLGAAGGEMAFDVQPNTEFNTLLMRVVSAVSEYEREQSALTHFDNASRGRRFQSTSGEFVRKAIRDFAANVSLRGWAGTAFTAERMARHVKKALQILNLPSVKNAFGVTTLWQVVERVSQREFGVTVNTVLHRTLAVETQTIMRIVADNHGAWSASGSPLFPELGQQFPDVIQLMRLAAEADRTGANPANLFLEQQKSDSDLSRETTRELMVACQHFRAVTGVGDSQLAEFSEPVEVAAVPSLPNMAGSGSSMPGIDMGGVNQLRDMVASGQAPSIDQLRAMLPGF